MQPFDIWGKSLFPTLSDYIIICFYLTLMFVFANYIKNRKIDQNPVYKYYVWGLFAKVAGAIALGLVYTLYYEEGDTTAYYRSTEALINLFFQNPKEYFQILLGDSSREAASNFTYFTGFPMYWGKYSSFTVVRITSLFTFLGFKNYFTTTILFAWFFYGGFWKLFLMATKIYPKYHKSFALGILFFPSVVFWGSGISKDAMALAAIGWFLYSLFILFIERRQIFQNLVILFLATMLILSIKPYIIVALVPGVFIWLAWNYINKIDNIFFRFITAPISGAVFLFVGFSLINLFSPFLGEYGSLDSIIHKAILTYEDHSRVDEYGQNFYSLGQFDGTAWNFFGKAPLAITTGLFRPFLWEVRNPVMLLAALENTAFLILVLIILWRTGFVKTVRVALDEPMIIFSISFAIVFAFAVGISTANFGALVRLKIPLIPFLSIGLFVLFNRSKEIKKERDLGRSKNLTFSS